jgi:hypothetical protein
MSNTIGGLTVRTNSHKAPASRAPQDTKQLYQMLPVNETHAVALLKVEHSDMTMLHLLEGVFVQLFGSLTDKFCQFGTRRPSYKSLIFAEVLIPTNATVPFRERTNQTPLTAKERVIQRRKAKIHNATRNAARYQRNLLARNICANCSTTRSRNWIPAHDGVGKIRDDCRQYRAKNGVDRPQSVEAASKIARMGTCSWSLCGATESGRWFLDPGDRTRKNLPALP